jgi:hypothetical protein
MSPDYKLPGSLSASVLQALRTLADGALGSGTPSGSSAESLWLRSQLARAAAGFALAAAWAVAVAPAWPAGWLWLPLAFPLLKQVADYLADGVFHTHPFAVNHADLIAAGFTDAVFWYAGVFPAVGLFGFDRPDWAFVGASVAACAPVALALAFGVWLPRARMLDLAGLPVIAPRLAALPRPADRLDGPGVRAVRDVQAFARGQQGVRHVVLFGGRPADRTALATALGGEFVGRRQVVYTASAAKLLESPHGVTATGRAARSAGVRVGGLVIDDLSVRLPIPREDRPGRQEQRREIQAQRAARLNIRLPAPREVRPRPPSGPGHDTLSAVLDPAAAATAEVAALTEQVIDLLDALEDFLRESPGTATVWVLSGGGDAAAVHARAWANYLRDVLSATGGGGAVAEVRLKDPPGVPLPGMNPGDFHDTPLPAAPTPQRPAR